MVNDGMVEEKKIKPELYPSPNQHYPNVNNTSVPTYQNTQRQDNIHPFYQ